MSASLHQAQTEGILPRLVQGARRLYTRFVRPPLLRYQPHIDETLQQLHASLVSAALASLSGFSIPHSRRIQQSAQSQSTTFSRSSRRRQMG
jgi:hypothetical protein